MSSHSWNSIDIPPKHTFNPSLPSLVGHLCFGAPRWYTQTICHAWATCPQRGQEVVCADHSIVIPRKKCPIPPQKEMWGSYYWHPNIKYIYIYRYIYFYTYVYRYYLLGSFNPNWKEYARQIGSSPHGKHAKNVVNHHQGRRAVHWFPSFRFRCPEVH